jgi:hypothetical protein
MLKALISFLCVCFSLPAQAKLGEAVPQLIKQTSPAAFSLDSSSTFSSPVTKQPARFDLRAGLDAKRGPRAEGWRFASSRRKGIVRVAKG